MPQPSSSAAGTGGGTTTAEHNPAKPREHSSSVEINAHISRDVCEHEATTFSNKDADSFHPSRAMQWALLGTVAVITIVMLVLPLALAILKGQALLAVPSAGTLALGYVWVRIAQFMFPLSKREHEYRMAKLWANCLKECSWEWGDRQSRMRKQRPPDNGDGLDGFVMDELARIQGVKATFDSGNTGSSDHKADT